MYKTIEYLNGELVETLFHSTEFTAMETLNSWGQGLLNIGIDYDIQTQGGETTYSIIGGQDYIKMVPVEFSEFWGLLGDEPTIIDKDTQETVLECDFMDWGAGTPIEEIWQEASKHYNKPLLEMLYGTE